MQLLEKYKDQFDHINNRALRPLLDKVEILDIDIDDHNNCDPRNTIFVGHKTKMKNILEVFQKQNIEHFVQVDRSDFFYDLFAACVMLKKPTAFISNPLPFFTTNFNMKAEEKDAVRSATFTFSCSDEKSQLLQSITEFLEENQKTANFLEAAHTIADELIMNAMFNAPVNLDGQPLFMNKDRLDTVTLPHGKKAKIFLTHDSRRLLIGCEDPYGSVNRFKLLSQLVKVHKDTASAPSLGIGGAGLGCKMMIDHSCGFHVVVKKNAKTLVCCALPLGVSFRAAEKFSKNLHFSFFS